MKILLTSTSFIDTPGIHQEKLNSKVLEIDKLRGPVKEHELLPIIKNYDGIICGDDEITKAVISAGVKGKLKIISKYGVGLDKIDLDAANNMGVKVKNCPGVNQVSVAEHIIALLFTYYKNIHLEHNITQEGKWIRLIGHELYGKTVGVLGLGKIGKEVSKRLIALGLKVSAYDINFDTNFANDMGIMNAKSINNLVNNIDILILTLPLNKHTKSIININTMLNYKKDMVIVNTSRALIIDQEFLINQLSNGLLKAYLTDVLEDEPMQENHALLNFDNVIITPHIGSRTYESVQRQGIMAVENLFNELKI